MHLLIGLSPSERAKALEETTLFAEAHVAASSLGQSAAPSADTVVDLHFITFVQVRSAVTPDVRRLVELDGRRTEPIDLGKSGDLLEVSAISYRRRYILRLTLEPNLGCRSYCSTEVHREFDVAKFRFACTIRDPARGLICRNNCHVYCYERIKLSHLYFKWGQGILNPGECMDKVTELQEERLSGSFQLWL